MDISEQENKVGFLDFLVVVLTNIKVLVFIPLALSVVAYFGTYLMTPIYKATTIFIPPTSEASVGSLLANSGIGSLLGVAPKASGGDKFKSFLESETLMNKMTTKFSLQEYYDQPILAKARKELKLATDIFVSKKDGMLTLSVYDKDPELAAKIANAYVEELNNMLTSFAITGAQKRSRFFAEQIVITESEIAISKNALRESGFKKTILNLKPERLLSFIFRYEDQLVGMESELLDKKIYLNDGAPAVRRLTKRISNLKTKLLLIEKEIKDAYGNRWETEILREVDNIRQKDKLLAFFKKQHEAAQVEMAGEGSGIQIVDYASSPELKAKPSRILITLMVGIGTGIFMLGLVLFRASVENIKINDPAGREKLKKIGF